MFPTVACRVFSVWATVIGFAASVVADDVASYQLLVTELNQHMFAKRRDEAEATSKQLLEFTDKTFPDDANLQFLTASMVVTMYALDDRYLDAQPVMNRALAFSNDIKQMAPALVPQFVTSLNLLADAFTKLEQHSTAIRLRKRGLLLVEVERGPNHPDLIQPLLFLGMAASRNRQYHEAEYYWRKAVAIGDASDAESSPYFAMALSFLASNLNSQHQFAEAEPFARRSLNLTAQGGAMSTTRSGSLGILAQLLEGQGRYSEAEAIRKQAIEEVQKQTLMLKEQFVASAKVDLARVIRQQGRFDEAEEWINAAFKDLQAESNSQGDAALIVPLQELVQLESDRGNLKQAQKTLARIFTSRDNPSFDQYAARARLHWRSNERKEAITDISKAIVLAEDIRKTGGGSERELAELYSQFSELFETSIGWYHDLGDVESAFAMSERFRARSMIDQLEVRGVDLLAGVAPQRANQLRTNEITARNRVVELERKSQVAKKANGGVVPAEIQTALVDARQTTIEAYRAIRDASPAFRLATHGNFQAAKLEEVKHGLARSRELLLSYVVGQQRSFVIAVPPAPQSPKIQQLILSDTAAAALNVSPGPFTSEVCRQILNRNARTLGVARGLDLSVAGSPSDGSERLGALWELLIPPTFRPQLIENRFDGLIVVPDGSLSLLPFEMLVTSRTADGSPRYLLDEGPPIRYAPSVTVLQSLDNRLNAAGHETAVSLLTVGDPNYALSTGDDRKQSLLAPIEVRAQFRTRGGQLNRLPASRIESDKLAQTFHESQFAVEQLLDGEATEDLVRRKISGSRVVHLACHGLTEQTYGNFFGALAMTPGMTADTNSADDGFLTVAESYELPLTDCDLAILSACETNYGPQQEGEGTWALSRGFLVAGAKRVIASNWLVDDEAAAELFASFATGVVNGYSKQTPINHAAALQAAKRRLRQRSRWSAPYYWAAFVLIGPN